MTSWRNVAAVGVAAAGSVLLQSATVLLGAALPTARAAGCPDAEVIFARGTTEDPGPGPTGAEFIDALRNKVPGKSVGVYAVDYPATLDFGTAVSGISDARAHILATAAACPDTKMVLGGFSQGAAVMGFVTASTVPDGVDPATVPAPMPPEIANHVAAVALFGKPSARFMRAINDPSVTVGPQYVAKTVDLCVDNDLVCDPTGRSFSAHNTYFDAGMVDQAAVYAANALQASWAAATPGAPTAPAAPLIPVTAHLGGPAPSATPAPVAPLGPPPGPVLAAPAPGAGPAPAGAPVL
ncbi:cutinase family protein [Mycolicibacterium canariasense]|uniref:cutinase family protein n=1 Tax=Mycolicibacterium canariasense TaxID=228230 RepID=UPI001F35147D|nr:cutinase family protein [Mycolicibacterium canariasense]